MKNHNSKKKYGLSNRYRYIGSDRCAWTRKEEELPKHVTLAFTCAKLPGSSHSYTQTQQTSPTPILALSDFDNLYDEEE